LSEAEHIERELMLIKVRAGQKEREDMKRMADIFRGRIIDVSDNTYTIELTGDGRKLDAFIHALDPASIMETVRTGTSRIGRGNRVLSVYEFWGGTDMPRFSFNVLLIAVFWVGFAGAALAERGEGETTARQGVVRCGGNNF